MYKIGAGQGLETCQTLAGPRATLARTGIDNERVRLPSKAMPAVAEHAFELENDDGRVIRRRAASKTRRLGRAQSPLHTCTIPAA